MNVLVACEQSGTVRDAFIEKGHNAISCDIQPTEKNGPHVQGDIKHLLKYRWDLIIAHPPCTYLANSGVCHLYEKDGSKNKKRWELLKEAVDFFNLFTNHSCPKICIENPIPHKYGIGKTYNQIIQPWMFGHKESKATCLWLKGLPGLTPTNNVKNEMMKLPANERQRLHFLSPSPERAKLRSRTFQGIAYAMAEQWNEK